MTNIFVTEFVEFSKNIRENSIIMHFARLVLTQSQDQFVSFGLITACILAGLYLGMIFRNPMNG